MSIIMDFIFQVPLLLIISLSLITTTTRAGLLNQICQDNGKYTTNSTYQTNLNNLLRSLSSNGSTTGFFTATQGSPPDQVDGLVLCRGDTNETTCAACLNNAVPDITQLCPYQKSAVIWYDNCLLRYSNLRIFNSPDESHDFCLSDAKNVSNPTLFFKTLNVLMGSLINRAVSSELFATGDVAVNGTQRLYGLVQCTRDLSGDSCADCLRDAIGEIPTCCAGKIGGRAVGASCNVRYEVYRFYGNSSLRTAVGGSPPPPPPPPLPPPPTTTMITQRRSKKNKLKIALLIIIPVILFLVIISVAFACLRKKMIIMKNVQSHQELHQITDIEPLVFDLAMLRIATNDFSDANKLGEGGFGVVYKGTLADGQEIAVKRLSKTSGQGLGELRNEIVLVTRLQHRNLVRLLGCCLEEQERLLIYEFIPNKSLDKFLFDPINIRQLTWERRYKIIEGIARGLLYLHEDSQLRIIHRDLKASNILLDKDMNPKISDFGLAKLFEMDQTQGNTSQVVGTYGYMAPEYAIRGHFSIKSDVFSFGVLVLEIMTGWRSNQFYAPDNATDLLSYVWKFWVEGRALDLISPSMGDLSRGKAMRCMHIALLCVQEDAMDRPNMSSVVLMLSSHSTSLAVPSRPAFYVGDSRVRLPDIENTTPDRSIATTESKSVSVNDVSITELEPR